MLKKIAFLALPLALALAFAACGGGSSSSSVQTSTTPNVVPVVVNAGPANNYANGAFASVTICQPGTSNCQTIPNVLVDTGSVGLRLIASQVTLSLNDEIQNGNPILQCNQFVDGFTWGPLAIADIKMAGEIGKAVPIQLIDDKGQFAVPSACSGTGPAENSVAALGANGVLGIGEWDQDCGTYCAQQIGAGIYYACPGGTCSEIRVPVNNQSQNPVFTFLTDNNGTILQLPAVSAPEAATVSGNLIFGIGTQSNNQLGSASVFGVDSNGNFTTTYNGNAYSGSYIDSGSNANFFLDPATVGMSTCPSNSSFYCPATTQTFTATNLGTNQVSNTFTFQVDNAETLFANTTIWAMPTLAGTNETTTICTPPGSTNCQTIPEAFDWGLPFFYGRNVYTAIEGQLTPAGTGPFWAY